MAQIGRLLPVVATASDPFQERAQAPCYCGFRGCNGATLKEQSRQEKAMTNSGPTSTFRGLPLTAEQDAEVRHYIKVRTQRGLPWDTSELNAMLKDMLQPPGDGNDEFDAPADETKAAAERAMASVDEAMEPIEASEERTAAMESESMKGPKR
jgi:hypothetical protein